MYIVNICGQKLGSCKFCKTLDSAMYNMHAKSGANASLTLCSLFYMYFVPYGYQGNHHNKIKHCIKGIISSGFVLQKRLLLLLVRYKQM